MWLKLQSHAGKTNDKPSVLIHFREQGTKTSLKEGSIFIQTNRVNDPCSVTRLSQQFFKIIPAGSTRKLIHACESFAFCKT